MTATDFLVVLITAPDKQTAERLSQVIMEGKKAACVNIIPQVDSIFRWQGSISTEQEVLLILKTKTTIFEDQLVPLVKEHHPYDVPEIIALPLVMGSKEYLNWMEEETE